MSRARMAGEAGYEGWVRLWRKSIDSEVFQKAELWRLWTYLMMRANYEERQLSGRTVKPGQLIISNVTLAERFGCDQSTIQRRMKKLEGMGNISMHPAKPGMIVTLLTWPTYNEPPDSTAKTVQRRCKDGASAPQTEEEVKKVITQEGNSLSPTATGAADKKRADEEDLLERERKFVALWNDLEGVRKTRGSSLEGKRRSHLRARLATQGWPADCTEAFKRFPLKCFGPDGWKPDIEWILKPDNVNKILEGKYDFTKGNGEPTPEPLDIAGALERTRKDGDDD